VTGCGAREMESSCDGPVALSSKVLPHSMGCQMQPGQPWVCVLRAVVLRRCMHFAAALEYTQGSKRTVISLLIRLLGNILYTGNVFKHV